MLLLPDSRVNDSGEEKIRGIFISAMGSEEKKKKTTLGTPVGERPGDDTSLKREPEPF